MRLFSYVVARDFGFAPNPFGGVCTLATCKPEIRQRAMVGDWVAGIASVADSRVPSLTYVMRVDEVLTYDAYWEDPRFHSKKPSRFGSVKQLFGDNIYRRDARGAWLQADSHHSLSNGVTNPPKHRQRYQVTWCPGWSTFCLLGKQSTSNTGSFFRFRWLYDPSESRLQDKISRRTRSGVYRLV